jgi:hypothetical protein
MLDAPVTESPPEPIPNTAADDLLTLNVKSLNLASNVAEEDAALEPVASIVSVVALTWAT